jgi:preprotein translocase subunit SecA
MTGTALTSQEEFYSVYKLDVIPVPTHREVRRVDYDDLIFQTERGKFSAVIAKVQEVHATGQPILIGTASIERNEALSQALAKAGITHQVLNAKNHEFEGEIIAQAGIRGAVTIATNMAGRGVDIKLGGPDATPEEADAIRALGGLFVIGTERHEARRIDNQLRGRSGRQGDPGATQFFVSMEDSLMRVFASDVVKSMMGKLGIPEDQPIQNSMITRSLESAQKKIEGFHFDARKHVLAYDDVLNKQRAVIYRDRAALLTNEPGIVDRFVAEASNTYEDFADVYEAKKAEFAPEVFTEVIRRLLLRLSDELWVEHLEVMQHTRSSVSLRAYGQQDPLIEYRKEAARLFKEMQEALYRRFVEYVPYLRIEVLQKEEASLHEAQAAAQTSPRASGDSSATKMEPARAVNGPGRNDLVTITNGTETQTLKYKRAEPMLRSGWKIVSS